MIDRKKIITIKNNFDGRIGYDVPNSNIHRDLFSGQSIEVPFEEIQQLYYAPGGARMLQEYLEIVDDDAAQEIFGRPTEPEYHYTQEQIIKIMKDDSQDGMNQFLDMLDFAPESVLDKVKDLAVSLPLDSDAKRQAILKKLNFDVTHAIEIRNTPNDGNNNDDNADKEITTPKRRSSAKESSAPLRRYNVVNK